MLGVTRDIVMAQPTRFNRRVALWTFGGLVIAAIIIAIFTPKYDRALEQRVSGADSSGLMATSFGKVLEDNGYRAEKFVTGSADPNYVLRDRSHERFVLWTCRDRCEDNSWPVITYAKFSGIESQALIVQLHGVVFGKHECFVPADTTLAAVQMYGSSVQASLRITPPGNGVVSIRPPGEPLDAWWRCREAV